MPVECRLDGKVELKKCEDVVRIISDIERIVSRADARNRHEDFDIDTLTISMYRQTVGQTPTDYIQHIYREPDGLEFTLEVRGNQIFKISEATAVEELLLDLSDYAIEPALIEQKVDDQSDFVYIGHPEREAETYSKQSLQICLQEANQLLIDDLLALADSVEEKLDKLEKDNAAEDDLEEARRDMRIEMEMAAD
jgi:hypothetical protein